MIVCFDSIKIHEVKRYKKPKMTKQGEFRGKISNFRSFIV